MKKIAALVCLSAGLFGLFPENAQAQRVRWSGFGTNSSYDIDINLTVQDSDTNSTKGVYSQAVNQFSVTFPDNPIQSSGLGNLTITQTSQTTADLNIEFDDNSPIKSLFLTIQDTSLFPPENFANVNNLLAFHQELSQTFFSIDTTNSFIFFKSGEPERLLAAEYIIVQVPEPNLIYSFIFMLPIGLAYVYKKNNFSSYLKIQNNLNEQNIAISNLDS